MHELWEINRNDTLNSRDNKTFGHAPAHPVRSCACQDGASVVDGEQAIHHTHMQKDGVSRTW